MPEYTKFVESRLTSINFHEKRKRIEFVFALSHGIECMLTADEVARMLVSEMREQNIVESVEVFDSTSNEEDIRWAVELLTATGAQVKSDEFISLNRSIIEQISNGEQVLLAITPVYGATVLALAKHVSKSA